MKQRGEETLQNFREK